jgi:hypothetical protein
MITQVTTMQPVLGLKSTHITVNLIQLMLCMLFEISMQSGLNNLFVFLLSSFCCRIYLFSKKSTSALSIFDARTYSCVDLLYNHSGASLSLVLGSCTEVAGGEGGSKNRTGSILHCHTPGSSHQCCIRAADSLGTGSSPV